MYIKKVYTSDLNGVKLILKILIMKNIQNLKMLKQKLILNEGDAIYIPKTGVLQKTQKIVQE